MNRSATGPHLPCRHQPRRRTSCIWSKLLLLVAAAALPLAIGGTARCQPPGGLGRPGGPGGLSRPAQTGAGSMGPQHPLDPSVKRTYVQLGQARGFLYEPRTPGPKSHIALFVMHFDADYTSFSACGEMSKRGYTVLCAANSGGGLDKILTDAKASIAFLRAFPGIHTVILFGHSGGGTLMTAYEEIAENGPSICQGPEKISKCAGTLTGFPPADGMILADSNWGNAAMALFSLDPAVLDRNNGIRLDPALDLFNPRNGFDPAGSHYSQQFIANFQHATGTRERQIIAQAQERLALIDAGKGNFTDDEPFVIAGGNSLAPDNKLFPEDIRLMSHTEKPWPLLHPGGAVTTEIVHSVRVPEGSRSLTPLLGLGAINSTVRGFLKNSAIRVDANYGFNESSVYGVDWTSTYASPPGNVENIHVPLLVLGMTGHWEYLASETIYNHSKSADKSLAFVEGAGHMFDPCKPCEKTPNQFGDTLETLYNYVDRWLAKDGRFPDR